MTDVATLGIKIDSSDAKKAERDLDSLSKTGQRLESTNRNLTSSFNAFRTVLGAVGLSVLISQGIQLADAYKNIQGRLALVTTGTAQLAKVSQDLFEVAQRSRVGFEDTANLYSSLARSTKALGTSQGDLLEVTETINKALIVSGASAATAQGALTQLGQGFASGTLRGDELNSVLEGTPRLAQAIADGMGIAVGQLRALGAEGKITGETVFNALKSQKDAVENEFAKMPVTISQSFTLLRNEILKFVGEADAASGVSSTLANSIKYLSQNLDGLVKTIEVLAVALGGRLAVAFVASSVATLQASAALIGLTTTAEVTGFAVGRLTVNLLKMAALAGVSLIIVGFVNAIQSADSSVAKANRTFAELQQKYAGIKAAAGVAASGTRDVGGAVVSAAPGFAMLTGKVRDLAAALYVQADAAKKARIEMAATNLAESRANEIKLGSESAAGRRDAIGGKMGALRRGDVLTALDPTPMALDLLNVLSGGRRDRDNANGRANAASSSLAFEKELKGAYVSPNGGGVSGGGGGVPAAGGGKTKGGGGGGATDASQEFLKSLKEETEGIGLNEIALKRLEIERAASATSNAALAQSIREAGEQWEDATIKQNAMVSVQDMFVDGANMARKAIEEETQSLAELSKQATEDRYKFDNDNAREYVDHLWSISEGVRNATQDFRELFGTAGEGFAELVQTITDYGARQEEVQERIDEVRNNSRSTAEDIARAEREGLEQSQQLQIDHYGNILHAAKGFFKENSAGYKVLEAAEKAYRLFQFAMSVKSIFMKGAETSASLTSDAVTTTSSVASSTVKAGASVVAGAAKMFEALGPFGFIAVGAMLAVMVALGFKGKKGGGGSAPSASADSDRGASRTSDSMSSPYSTLPGAGGLYDPKNAGLAAPGSIPASNDNYATRGGLTVAPTYNINAPGADAGTVDQIKALLVDHQQETVELSVEASMAQMISANTRQRIGSGA